MQKKTFEVDIAGKMLIAEFTDLTDQANGSVILRMGETAILVTAVMSSRVSNMPYFPLSVEFEEKFYAAGKMLGSFNHTKFIKYSLNNSSSNMLKKLRSYCHFFFYNKI